ncbi:MAG: tetratricopeptide repeat protein [bacterium]|nr:tetratricopeptide repeat protein [bacterium]
MFSQKYKDFLKIFLPAVIIAFVLFGPSLDGDFTLDDHSVIEKGVQLKSLKNIFELWVSPWHPGGQWAGNYRPLTTTSFALNTFFSEDPLGFRIVNVLLYVLNIVFIFYFVRRLSTPYEVSLAKSDLASPIGTSARLLRTGSTEKVAYLTAIIFLFLPIHSEVVMSIVGRVYLLGTIFSLLSLCYFLDRKYWLSSGYFLLALFSGDTFISLILVIGALLFMEYRSLRKTFWLGMTYVAGLPIYFLFRYLALDKYAFGGYGFVDPIIGPLAFVSVKERVFTALSHLYLYLRKTIYPVDLSPDYSFNQIPIVLNLFLSWRALIGLTFLAIVIYIFYKLKRKDIKFAVILFLIPYLVMSNIFFITTGTMAERWWYFPSLGLMMLVAIGIENLLKMLKARFLTFSTMRLACGAGIILLVWYASIIFRQNKVWFNDRNLFIYASEKSPNSAWARTNVAEGFFLSGDVERAKKEIEAALKISDKYPSTLYVLGQIYWKEGRFGEAEEVFKKAIKFDIYDRNKRSLYRSLALVSLDVGNNKLAVVYMQEAVKWPATGDIDKTLKIDKLLLQKVEEYSDRDTNSYTQDEIEGLVNLIKILRGF